jgi:hypothetical protein
MHIPMKWKRKEREKENKEQQRLTIDPLPTHVGAMGRALQATSNATVEKGDLMSREVACVAGMQQAFPYLLYVCCPC